MKKVTKTILIAGLLVLSIIASAKIIKLNYNAAKSDFLLHGKGKAQQFIYSFIN
jgi:hypothetical protein